MVDIDSDFLDYIRYRELELLSHEIMRNQVSGEVAEVGVYRGDFASKINALFPTKKLYLFDTFTGFNSQQLEEEKNKGFMSDEFLKIIHQYKNTNIVHLLNQMIYPNQCIIKQGDFPKSIDELDEKFCFVSIDVDFYRPTYDALEYFYPRLGKKGIIMVHDYNHDELFGVKQAVHDYEVIVPELRYIPLSDQCGSIIIIK